MISVKRQYYETEDLKALINELDEYLGSLYPDESNHLTPLEELFSDDFEFWVAERNGILVGCVGADISKPDYAELKRMFVDPAQRGKGIANRLLVSIEKSLFKTGFSCIRLETGVKQCEAIGFYRKYGYKQIGPFGSYQADPLSEFYEKRSSI